jgi:lipoate---protein ligase
MSHALRVLLADTTDPFFNLATEDWIFHDMSPDTKVLFLWRNDRSIIVGRGQNVWSECDLTKVEEDGVHVVRRHSGGGAVYQDLGNTCFTFMCAKEPGRRTKELYARNNQILLKALGELGVVAQASGRNDLTVEQNEQAFKISGSAFKESKDRCFHHGTMLMNVDLTKLSGYLTPNSKKLKAKGIKSVGSRVMNLADIVPGIGHDIFLAALIQQFFHHYESQCEVEHLNTSALREVGSLSNYYEKLKSWDWVYGKTPHFHHTLTERFEWGCCELHLDTEHGHIGQARLYTDSLYPEVLQTVPNFLQGKPYTPNGVHLAQKEHLQEETECSDLLTELYDWIAAEI